MNSVNIASKEKKKKSTQMQHAHFTVSTLPKTIGFLDLTYTVEPRIDIRDTGQI